MKVWAVVVNSKVDSLHTTAKLALDRQRLLVAVNGDQLAVHCQEFTVNGYFEETE